MSPPKLYSKCQVVYSICCFTAVRLLIGLALRHNAV